MRTSAVMQTRALLCSVLLALVGISSGAQAPQAVPYDHIHLAAPDPDKAYDWYVTNLGGQAGENTGRMVFEPFTSRRPLPVQLMFIKADALPSEGGVIDSIGFSFADVAAKVKALETAGAKIIEPAREVQGLWKRAVVVDPYGVKIELVEDRGHPESGNRIKSEEEAPTSRNSCRANSGSPGKGIAETPNPAAPFIPG